MLSDPEARRAYDARLSRAACGLSSRPVQPSRPAGATTVVRPSPVRRALSGGEWFALLLLGVALVLSLVLGIGVAWARGMELMNRPSWWVVAPAAGDPVVVAGASPAAASPAGALPQPLPEGPPGQLPQDGGQAPVPSEVDGPAAP